MLADLVTRRNIETYLVVGIVSFSLTLSLGFEAEKTGRSVGEFVDKGVQFKFFIQKRGVADPEFIVVVDLGGLGKVEFHVPVRGWVKGAVQCHGDTEVVVII